MTDVDVSTMSYDELLLLAQKPGKLPKGFINRLNKVSPLTRDSQPDGLRSVPLEVRSCRLIRRSGKHLSD